MKKGLLLVLLVGLLSTTAFGGLFDMFKKNKKPKMTELKVVMGLGESEWKVLKEEIFPAFEEEHNVKVVPYQIEAGNVIKKLEALAKAGKSDIDLIAQDNMALAPLVDKGLVEDLTGYKNMVPDKVIPALLKVGTFNNRLYFLPFRPNVEITLYNENKFNEYGLTPPTTWDELLEVAKVFKEKEGVGRVLGIKAGGAGDTTVHLFDYIRSAGGDPLVLNDAGSVKAFEFLKELQPYMSPDFKQSTWDTTNKFTATESMYLSQNWPFAVNVIVKDGGKKEIKAYGGWQGPEKASHVLGGDVFGIPMNSPNKELAMKFIAHMMRKDTQEILVSKLGWSSSRSDAYGTVEEWQKPYFKAVNDAMASAEPRPNVTYWTTVDKSLNGAFKEIMFNDAPIKATLDKYAAMIEKAKNK